MHFELDDDTRLLQRTVRDFATAEIAPAAEALDRDKRFPYELVAKMGELGWMGIPFPESAGGAGGTSLHYAIAVEELTRVDSSVAITMCAHTSLGTQSIYLFGAEEQAGLGPIHRRDERRRRTRRHRVERVTWYPEDGVSALHPDTSGVVFQDRSDAIGGQPVAGGDQRGALPLLPTPQPATFFGQP